VSGEEKPRRSAGMRGSPMNPVPEHRPVSTVYKAMPEAPVPQRTSSSRFARPEVLMGEVAAPKGQLIAARRDAFRAFMTARHLRPSEWAQAAGVPANEILAFLTGCARAFSPGVAEKLAAAANATVADMLG
jgi:hypothetical protein